MVPKIWNVSLFPNEDESPMYNQVEQTMLGVYIAYDPPSVAALVR